jgi:hypothetical protein
MNTTPATPPSPPLVLVFAASDPSSGAGIQADLLTLASLGCHPLTALTAITVQDTVGVQSVHPLAAELVEQQARAILEDMPVAAFKIGVLGSVENVLAVAEIVSDYPEIPLISTRYWPRAWRRTVRRGNHFRHARNAAAANHAGHPQRTGSAAPGRERRGRRRAVESTSAPSA